MRSPKSRSRGKSNRGRSPANNVNRVFDSSGPEGKVRGTPQQIIDKYLQLSRDATLGNDRVAAENFMQHAEHYVRLLAEAQRDADEKRQQAEQQNRDRQQQQQQQKQRERDQQEQPKAPREDKRANGVGGGDAPAARDGSGGGDVVDNAPDNADSGLVETPEMKPKKTRRPRKPKAAPESAGPDSAKQDAPSDAGE